MPRKTFCTDVSNLEPEERKEFAKILKKTTEDFNKKIAEKESEETEQEGEDS